MEASGGNSLTTSKIVTNFAFNGQDQESFDKRYSDVTLQDFRLNIQYEIHTLDPDPCLC